MSNNIGSSTLDNQEQYNRRNSVQINGITEQLKEDIYTVSLELLNNAMKLERSIAITDLDRAHRVGSGEKKNRAVLVKFSSYQSKMLLMRNRKQLREDSFPVKDIYINEDLTKSRAALLYQARLMKKKAIISDCWSYDGKILIKTTKGKIIPVASTKILEQLKKQETPSPTPPTPRGANEDSPVTSPGEQSNTVKESDYVKIIQDNICFMAEGAPLSNWFPAPITIDNKTYSCNEQYIFASKAQAAKDKEALDEILSSSSPKEHKAIGSRIKVRPEQWDEIKEIKKAIDAKFDQHEELKQYLVDTEDFTLCEATRDKTWGIGFTINSRDLPKVEKWSGKNLLGQMLMDKRAKLKVKVK